MRHRLAPWFLALAVGLAAPAAALAQSGDAAEDPARLQKGMDPERDDEPLEGDKVRDEGDYGGVRPGVGPRDGKVARRPGPQTLSWIGFQGADGTARIFVQGTSEMTVTQRVEGATLVVHLAGVKKLGRQVQRALETRYFDSPVARVVVKKVKAKKARKARKGRPAVAASPAGIELRVAFKQKADVREAAARTSTEADGYHYVYLELAETQPSGQ